MVSIVQAAAEAECRRANAQGAVQVPLGRSAGLQGGNAVCRIEGNARPCLSDVSDVDAALSAKVPTGESVAKPPSSALKH